MKYKLFNIVTNELYPFDKNNKDGTFFNTLEEVKAVRDNILNTTAYTEKTFKISEYRDKQYKVFDLKKNEYFMLAGWPLSCNTEERANQIIDMVLKFNYKFKEYKQEDFKIEFVELSEDEYWFSNIDVKDN